MSNSDIQFVSLQTAAIRAAVSPKTIRRSISRGELEAFQVGGQLRLKSADVDCWLISRPLVTVKR